jgi:glycosyltransferase involved in cell wall biosynthesis
MFIRKVPEQGKVLKMIVLSHTSHLGGAELSMLELVKALSRNMNIYIIIPMRGPIVNSLDRYAKHIYTVPFFWWCAKRSKIIPYIMANFLNLVSFLLTLRVVLKVKPDICLTNTIASPPILGVACKLLNIPHIWYIHEFGKEDHELYFIVGEKIGYNIVARLSSAIFVNSTSVAKKISKFIYWQKVPLFLMDNIVEMPSQILTDKESNDKLSNYDAKIKIAHIATIKQGKGQEDLVLALSMLKEKVDFICYIIGSIEDKNYYRKLKQWVEKNRLIDSIIFTGYLSREKALQVMKNSDIIVLCSRSEAFGRVIVEGMKLGKAVIATRSGGVTDKIKDGKNGLLYEPRNVEELAQKIMLLANDRQLRENLGRNAQQYSFERFNKEKIVRKTFEIICQIASK